MKTVTSVFIVIGIVLIVAGGAVTLAGLAVSGFNIENMNTNDPFIEKVYEFASDEVDSFEILDNSPDIKVICGDYDFVKVVTHENKNNAYSVAVNSGKLSVSKSVVLNINPPSGSKKTVLEITLPDKLYKLTEIHSVSGNVELFGVDAAETIKVASVSGDVKLGNISAQTITLETVSGKAIVENADVVDLLKIKTESGDMMFSNIVSKNKIIADTTSGNIIFENITAEDISFNTVSGDVFGTTADNGYCFDAFSVSGDISEGLHTHDGSKPFKVSTVSGDILVSRM